MNRESYLVHSNTMRKVLKENYGFSDVSIVRAEQRIYGINYLVEISGTLYYVKCSSYLNEALYKQIVAMFSAMNSPSAGVYTPKIVTARNDIVSFELDATTYYVYVTEYINGLSRYKDVSLRYLNVDLPGNMAELSKDLQDFQQNISSCNETNQSFEDRCKLVEENVSKIKTKDGLNFPDIDVAAFMHLLSETTARQEKVVVHGNLGNNIFLDQNMNSVVFDFDDVSIGSYLEDISRLVANLEFEDILHYMNSYKGILPAENYVDLETYVIFSMLFEVIECYVNYDTFMSLVGLTAVESWLQNKMLKLTSYLNYTERTL